MLKVSPIAGVIPPYGSTKLCVTFKPFSPDGGRGFAAQPLNPTQQVQPFDGLLQVSTSKMGSGRHAGLSCCFGFPTRPAGKQCSHSLPLPATCWQPACLAHLKRANHEESGQESA